MGEDFFENGVVEVINKESLKKRLASKKLRVKYGVDPTRPDIHLGHAVALWKLKELQEKGHQIIFLIGDYTTKIGDPSGRNTTRPILTDAEIRANAKTYFDQVGKILDLEKTEIRYNSEWFSKLSFSDIIQLAGKFTVAQIIERDDFENRLKGGNDIGLHEILYPVMQAYDSIVLKADVEVGGADQKFNLLAGRDLQRKFGETPQELIILKLLVGLDGNKKMSKSADNFIAIAEEPFSMFSKTMSIPDDLIFEYFSLCTDRSSSEIEKYQNEMKTGRNPRDIKIALAEAIVTRYHSAGEAKQAEGEFKKIFSKRELPSDIPVVKIESGNYDLPMLLMDLSAVNSQGEARRLIEQGGLVIDGARLTDPNATIAVKKGMIIQVGKRKHYQIG